LGRSFVFASFHRPRIVAVVLLLIPAFGLARGGKAPGWIGIVASVVAGAVLYFGAPVFFYLDEAPRMIASLYLIATGLGFLLIGHGVMLLGRRLRRPVRADIFNTENQHFPQEQRLLEDEFTINLQSRFRDGGRVRKGWINIDPRR